MLEILVKLNLMSLRGENRRYGSQHQILLYSETFWNIEDLPALGRKDILL